MVRSFVETSPFWSFRFVSFRHPNEMSFVTTSADRTCLVWAPPLSALNTLAQSPWWLKSLDLEHFLYYSIDLIYSLLLVSSVILIERNANIEDDRYLPCAFLFVFSSSIRQDKSRQYSLIVRLRADRKKNNNNNSKISVFFFRFNEEKSQWYLRSHLWWR